MLKLIVCVGENNLLGDRKPTGNGLLWNSKEELNYYKETTLGHVTLFGKSTASCVPIELMKKTREVIILNRDTDIPKLLKDYEKIGKDVFICGGETIYRYFLENHLIDEILVSHLKPHIKVEKANEPLYFPNVENYGYSPKEILEYEDFFVYIYKKN